MPDPTMPVAGPSSAWIDKRCDQFEKDWQQGRRPRIEDVLADLPAEHRAIVLRELLGIELELRQGRGDQIPRSEYQQRFPDSVDLLDEFEHSFAHDPDRTEAIADLGTTPTSATTSARYHGLRLFRRGGLGALYRAIDESLHRETIVKFMNEKCHGDPALMAQFRVEAEVTSRLDHPGIVPVYGLGEDWHGRPFYVMRLINGRELKEAIQEFHQAGGMGRRSNRPLLLALLEHLASACNTVAYAHHVGIVHCDLKPANIMIGKYGETFVLDWGLATSFERTSTFFVVNEPTMRPHSATNGSSSGHRGGTYGYVSPEQLCTDAPLGPTSDVYSLGATLYEILTGQPPFNGRDRDVTELIRRGEFAPPRKLQRGIPRRLEAICLKAMSLVPQQRYSTAKHLAADLASWMRDDEVEAAPDRWFHRVARLGRRHWVATMAALVVAMTVVVAAAWSDHNSKVAAHAEAMREQADRLREAQAQAHAAADKIHAAEAASFTNALDTFEAICHPMANGEMNNLDVLRPFVEKIKNFTTVYLENFETADSMRLHTGRVYELRAIMSRVYWNDSAAALQDYQRAEAIYLELTAAEAEKFDRPLRLANIRLSLGRLLCRRDEFDKASRVLDLAAAGFEKLAAERADDRVVQRLLAETYHCQGEVFLYRETEGAARTQSLLTAEKHLNQSRELRERLVKTAIGEERRNQLRDLARNLAYLGSLYQAKGEISLAWDCYEQSKTQRAELYTSNQGDPEHRFQYARGLRNVGDMARAYGDDLTRAIDELNKARQFEQDLADEFPLVAGFPVDLAQTQNMLAEVYLMAAQRAPGQKAEFAKLARQSTEQANELYKGIYRNRSSPEDTSGMHGLALSYVWASLLATDDERKESLLLAQQAEGLLLPREPSLSSPELVTLAMVHSLQGKTKQSLTCLEDAVKRGENTAFRFERHAHLAFQQLAEDPTYGQKFEALCQRVRSSLKVDE